MYCPSGARGAAFDLGRWMLAVWLLALLGPWSPAHAVHRVLLQPQSDDAATLAGYLLAQDRGYFRSAGLDVVILPAQTGVPSALDAVEQGRADFGLSDSSLAVARMRGRGVVAVSALLQRGSKVWLLRSELAGQPLASLTQARLAAPPPGDDSSEWRLPLVEAGLGARVDAAAAGAGALERFAAGELDLMPATRNVEPLELKRRGVPFALIDPCERAASCYGEVLFTSVGTAHRDASMVRRFRDAALKGWRDAWRDVDATALWLQQQRPGLRPAAQLAEQLRVLRDLAVADEVEPGQMSPSRWQALAERQRAAGMGETLLQVDDFVFDLTVAGPPAVPDPVRLGLFAVSAALVLTVFHLLRINNRLIEHASRLRHVQQGPRAEWRRLQFLLESAPFPTVVFDLDHGLLRYANERAREWIERAGADPAGPVGGWVPLLEAGSATMQLLASGRMLRDHEVELPSTAECRWLQLSVRAIEYEGQACGFAVFSDISQRKRAEVGLQLLSDQRGRLIDEMEGLQAKLREASVRDGLTGLYNRRYFDATIEREWLRCQREGRAMALLVIDVDHFKAVNDTYGHEGGDQVLRKLGGELVAHVRGGDVCCRLGGEEFVVLMPGAEVPAAVRRAESLREMVTGLVVETVAGPVRFTVSIGLSVLRDPGDDVKQLFRRADAAVYRAKREGRNRVCTSPEASSPAPEVDRAREPARVDP